MEMIETKAKNKSLPGGAGLLRRVRPTLSIL